MSALRQWLDEYLLIRRAMGYELERHEKLLGQFIDYLAARGEDTISIENALAWATSPAQSNSRWWSLRLSMVRGFAVHLHAIDPAHQIPPTGMLPDHGPETRPYLYTEREITALIRAAGQLPGEPVKALTYQTLIRLLSVTGMRVGEAIGLDREDFDDQGGLVTVRETKFGKSRQLPLHPSATAGLQQYLDQRDQLLPHPRSAALLLSSRGFRLHYNGGVWDTFNDLRAAARLEGRFDGSRPRLHDLRHTFAVSTLLDWYRHGADVPAMLPRLSTYLGHTDPKHTYWYLSAAPELLALAADRLEAKEAQR